MCNLPCHCCHKNFFIEIISLYVSDILETITWVDSCLRTSQVQNSLHCKCNLQLMIIPYSRFLWDIAESNKFFWISKLRGIKLCISNRHFCISMKAPLFSFPSDKGQKCLKHHHCWSRGNHAVGTWLWFELDKLNNQNETSSSAQNKFDIANLLTVHLTVSIATLIANIAEVVSLILLMMLYRWLWNRVQDN
jgi:hypothetical protein